jgi:hypothetical protein
VLSKDLNIIVGDFSSGKTTTLLEISRFLHNRNIIFLEVDGQENNFKIEKLRHLSLKLSNIQSNIQSDLKILDMVEEMVSKNNIEYLIIDDFDSYIDGLIERILKIKTKKIFTINILSIYNSLQLSAIKKVDTNVIHTHIVGNEIKIEYKSKIYDLVNFIKTINRDQKISKLLDEE